MVWQVEVEGKWQNLNPEEVDQIEEITRRGERLFQIRAHGNAFNINLMGERWTRVNVATGKVRFIRNFHQPVSARMSAPPPMKAPAGNATPKQGPVPTKAPAAPAQGQAPKARPAPGKEAAETPKVPAPVKSQFDIGTTPGTVMEGIERFVGGFLGAPPVVSSTLADLQRNQKDLQRQNKAGSGGASQDGISSASTSASSTSSSGAILEEVWRFMDNIVGSSPEAATTKCSQCGSTCAPEARGGSPVLCQKCRAKKQVSGDRTQRSSEQARVSSGDVRGVPPTTQVGKGAQSNAAAKAPESKSAASLNETGMAPSSCQVPWAIAAQAASDDVFGGVRKLFDNIVGPLSPEQQVSKDDAPPTARAPPSKEAPKPKEAPKVKEVPAVPHAPGRKRALLIGINYRGTSVQLSNSTNDVADMHKLLVETFEWPAECICAMTDTDPASICTVPTWQNINAGLRWLVDGARAGDSLFFFYSGHAMHKCDPHGYAKECGALLPLDFQEAGMMTDDHLAEIIVRHLPEGVRLTAVMDCCHPGLGLDLPFKCTPKGWEEERNPYFSRGDVQLFSSCEASYGKDMTHSRYGQANGCVTSTFCEVLRACKVLRGNPNLTYSELMGAMQFHMRDHNHHQQPTLSSSQRFVSGRHFSLEEALPNQNTSVGRIVRGRFEPQPRPMMGPLGALLAQDATKGIDATPSTILLV